VYVRHLFLDGCIAATMGTTHSCDSSHTLCCSNGGSILEDEGFASKDLDASIFANAFSLGTGKKRSAGAGKENAVPQLLIAKPVMECSDYSFSASSDAEFPEEFAVPCSLRPCCCEEDASALGDAEPSDYSEIFVDASAWPLPPLSMLKLSAIPVIALPKEYQDVVAAPTPVDDGVPLAEGVESLSPELVNGLLECGRCILVDVRGADRVAGLIDGAVHIPACSAQEPFTARLPGLVQRYSGERLLVFFCQFSKHRAPVCANLFREQTTAAGNTMQRIAVMEGGFRAWQRTNLPVNIRGADDQQARADAWAYQEGILMAQKRHL